MTDDNKFAEALQSWTDGHIDMNQFAQVVMDISIESVADSLGNTVLILPYIVQRHTADPSYNDGFNDGVAECVQVLTALEGQLRGMVN